MIKCRACKCLEVPAPPGHDDWVYMAALNDAQLGIKPRLCERHQKLLANGADDRIVKAAAEWDAKVAQEEQAEEARRGQAS